VFSEPFTRPASRSLAARGRSLIARAVGWGSFAPRRAFSQLRTRHPPVTPTKKLKPKKSSAMKTTLASAFRLTALATTLLALPVLASAKDNAAADRAAEMLAVKGRIPVSAAGPYVEVGTFRIQVIAKLGRPDATLSDGTLLYPNFTADGSDATGTLVVRFNQGRVSELALVTSTVATAMVTPRKAGDKVLVASSK
jgi:hypothetical protein